MGDDYDAVVADTADDRNPAGARAKLFAALASGIIGGATLGAVLFGYKASHSADRRRTRIRCIHRAVARSAQPCEQPAGIAETSRGAGSCIEAGGAGRRAESHCRPNRKRTKRSLRHLPLPTLARRRCSTRPSSSTSTSRRLATSRPLPNHRSRSRLSSTRPTSTLSRSGAGFGHHRVEAGAAKPAGERGPVPEACRKRQQVDNEAVREQAEYAESAHEWPRDHRQALTMTVAGDWHIVGPSGTDAELVVASVAGDRDAFAGIYDRYADRLHDFCCGILHDRDGAADCVQDVFCIAAVRMTQLRDPAKLRPWLYAIARTEALRRIRDRRRGYRVRRTTRCCLARSRPRNVRGPSANSPSWSTTLRVVFRPRSVGARTRLPARHGWRRPRRSARRQPGQRERDRAPAARNRRTGPRGVVGVSRCARHPDRCGELAAILDGWDGTFTVLMRKRVARHIEGCATCDEERRRLVNPVALLGAAPVFIPAPAWLRERTLGEVELTTSASPFSNDHDGGTRHTSSAKLPAALFLAALVAALGLSLVWLQQVTTTAVSPVQISDTPPPPPVAPVKGDPPAPPQSAIKAPPPPVPAAPRPTPVVRPPVVQTPTQAPPPEPPPVVDEPAILDPPAPPPEPPLPPPPPPLQWPPQWELPQWEFPQWPAPPPGGGTLTGPPNLVIDPPGGTVPPL